MVKHASGPILTNMGTGIRLKFTSLTTTRIWSVYLSQDDGSKLGHGAARTLSLWIRYGRPYSFHPFLGLISTPALIRAWRTVSARRPSRPPTLVRESPPL
jgi:hypothetical protein